MAGKDFTGRGMDVVDDVILALGNIEKRLKYLETARRTTVPGYNFETDNPGDRPIEPIEGQVAVGLDNNKIQYFVNGEWRTPTIEHDPATVLERARIWSTEEARQITVHPGEAKIFPFNHGWTTNPEIMSIEHHGGIGPATDVMRIRIWESGVYGITFRFYPQAMDTTTPAGADWNATRFHIGCYDPTPDNWFGIRFDNKSGNWGGFDSFVTSKQCGDPDWGPDALYFDIVVPTGWPALRFNGPFGGDFELVTQPPSTATDTTACYCECVRLGDADMSDWAQWWFDTPTGEAGEIPHT